MDPRRPFKQPIAGLRQQRLDLPLHLGVVAAGLGEIPDALVGWPIESRLIQLLYFFPALWRHRYIHAGPRFGAASRFITVIDLLPSRSLVNVTGLPQSVSTTAGMLRQLRADSSLGRWQEAGKQVDTVGCR